MNHEALLLGFVEWCKKERAKYERLVELMEGKQFWTNEMRGGVRVDTTTESLEQAKARMAELDDLLVKAQAQE
jgi:hypothetical protein